MSGKLTLIIGPMFSGKSSLLINKLHRYSFANKKALLIRPATDNRGYLTHSKEDFRGDSTHETKLLPIKINLNQYDCVGIDEAQFYDYKEFANDVNDYLFRGLDVIVAALNGTAEQQQWPSISKLLPWAEEIIKLNAVCVRCGGDASFSYYRGGKSEIVKVGGIESYEALCRSCLDEEKWNSPKKDPVQKELF